MPHYIVKLTDDRVNKDYYMEWSTIVDAPISDAMSLDEFHNYYREKHGSVGMKELHERLGRVKITGCSRIDGGTLEGLIATNRAGPEEECLSKHEIIDFYNPQVYGKEK